MPPSSRPSAGATAGIPAIRTFQLDASAVGRLSSAVNLFRGDVNLPQHLFTMPGRHRGSGLDVDFTALYQSNVYRDALTWNRDAPTGVLGLGWNLPLTYIAATDSGSPDPDTRDYALYDNGTPGALVRQPWAPYLFGMPAALASGLQAGQPVPAGVQAQFLSSGLPLSAGARVSGGPAVWTVADDALQQVFTLEIAGSQLNVSYGGQAFQLQNYRFWHIVYFPAYERWLIVDDHGIKKSFGGLGPSTAQGYRTAAGNSVAWQVWWSPTAGGAPLWTGPSSATAGQVQVARAWYLASTANPFGDTVTYVYNGWPRNAAGLIPEVEQPVGAGGLLYTKAVYLTRVTDVFGRTATLGYGEKLVGDGSADASPREYDDPHRAVPGNAPNAYQDCYETKYLAQIALADQAGAPLLTVLFEYAPSPSASGPAQAVANVTSFTGALQGDTYKRYLTGIAIENADGDALPGYRYGYYLDPTVAGAQPGALATVTCPEGGTVTYAYTQQTLAICDRDRTILMPSDIPEGMPRVFYGDDYVVSLWYDTVSGMLTLQVFTWMGGWILWQLDPASTVLDTGGIEDLTTLNVLANPDFFAICFQRSGLAVAYAFNKDRARPGQFKPATVNGMATAVNVPTLTVPFSTGTVAFVGGGRFFAAVPVTGSAAPYQVLTWRWTTQAWDVQTITPANATFLAAAGEYLLAVDWDGNVALSYLDGTLAWREAAPLAISNFSVPGENPDNVALAAGTGLAVLTLLTASNPTRRTYQVIVLQWDANHVLQVPAVAGPFTDLVGPRTPLLPWTATVVTGGLIAINGNLLRFDGTQWLTASLAPVNTPPQGQQVRFAYGPDYVLQVLASGPEADATVLGFDPGAGAWGTPATQALPTSQEPWDNFPAGGGEDWAVLGPLLYFRGTATDWGVAVTVNAPQDIGALAGGGGFNSQSLIAEGPAFLSYSAFPSGQPGAVSAQALILQNGQLSSDTPVAFGGQKMYTPSIEGPLAGPGVSPQGPGVFVTYTSDSDFDQATRIALHRDAGNAVSGPLTHYPVTRVDIADQYQDVASTSYAPDPATAGCDPTGQVIKYYTNTTYPGTSDPGVPSYGYTVSRYLNGLGGGQIGPNYYDMLDGLLIRTETHDSTGALLASQDSTWVVVQEVASDPVDPAAPPIRLCGGWIAQTQSVAMRDGVSRVRTTDFVSPGMSAPYTGRPAAMASQSYGGAGGLETFTRAIRYGVEVDPALRALNMRSTPAQATTIAQLGSSGPLVVKSSASTFSTWPSAAGPGLMAPAKEGSFILLDATAPYFPYGAYTPGTVPDGWLLKGRVTARTPRGQIQSSEDAAGTATSVIFSADLALPVAHVSNAGVGAAAYLGFEPYENETGWTVTNAVPDSSSARTGTTSLRLPGGAQASLAVSVALAAGPQTYVVGYWYQTPPGFVPVATAGAIVAVGGTATTTPFGATQGQWALQTIGVPVPAGGGAPVIQVTIANPAGQDVLLDCAWVVPLVGGLIARTYHPSTRNLTSAMDAAGRTRWMYWDRFERRTLQVGPSGQPKELAQRFLSRQGSRANAFEPMSPNAELTLHPAGGGTLETFRDGSAWQQVWTPANAAAWSAADGALAHLGSNDDSLTYRGGQAPTWAVYFEVAVGSDPPSLSLSAGAVIVSYFGGTYFGSFGSAPMSPLVATPQMARHWLLVAGDGVVLFFGDGQLIFSQSAAIGPCAPVLATSADLTFLHLAFLASPRVGLAYHDGSGRRRQVHQLHGSDSRVAEVIFDPLGRQVAVTRVAPGSFGSGAGQPVLQYRPGFVDVAAFLASLGTTGVMTGDVADYYQGQVVNGIQRSNDQGYPYRATAWEASPRRRAVELGLPGLPYAIANPATTTPAQRATTQFAYGENAGTDPTLPAGQYAQTAITTPVKRVAYRVSDKLGQSVAALQNDATGALTAQSSGRRVYASTASGPQTTLSLALPNALVSGPQSGNAAFARTTVADATGRAVATSGPNAGQTQFLYDACGRVRFVQPALDTGEQYFFYTRYDPVGRVLEQGTVSLAWDPATLAPCAAQPDWPTPDVPHTVARAWIYDGDGNDPTQIGQKINCMTVTPAAPGGTPCRAIEAFVHDAAGQLIGVALQVSGPAFAQGALAYVYNNLGELVDLMLPLGSPLTWVRYTHDDQGMITAISSPESAGADIAAYTYTMDGLVETETLGGAWTRAVQYASPGWVQQVVTTSADGQQSLTMAYTYNPDSTVASRQITYAFPPLATTLADSFTYDGQGRLVSAQGASDDQVTAYDPNGNIWGVETGGAPQSFALAPGTDEIAQATIGGQTTPVTYDARGRVTGALGRTFGYDNATGLTVAAATATQAVQLGYGGHGQRVLKQVSGASTGTAVYFTGASKLPVARLDGATGSALVYGPTGLVAVWADQAYYPIKDNERSAWALVDAGGLVGRYVYLPFGRATAAGGPNPGLLYMGQEWDAEVGLYNFGARMYDPLLRRFLSPDQARQFPSPYVFAANNPLTVTDPTGDLSLWGRIGIGVAMGAILVAGIALTVATAGAAAPAAVAAEGAVAGAEAGVLAGAEAGAVAGTEAGALAGTGAADAAAAAASAGGAAGGNAAADAASAAAESGAAAAGQVSAGAGASATAAEGGAATAASTISAVASNAGNLAMQAGIGAVQGVGASGLQYDIENGRSFTAKAFFENLGWGAASGALGGALGGIPGMPALEETMGGLSQLAKSGINVLAQGIAGATASDVTTILSNVAGHDPWYSGLAEATYLGFGESAAIGGLTEGIGNRTALSDDLKAKIGDDNLQTARTALQKVQEAAVRPEAYMCYGVGAFFVVAGFSVWGADALFGHRAT